MYGDKLGNDMVGGMEGAREVGAKLFLIDRPIEETMLKLKYACIHEFLNPLEMFRKFLTLFSMPLSSEMPALATLFPFRDFMDSAIREFEADPEKYRSLLGEIYPFFKRIILDEREEYMAGEIRKVVNKYGYDPICVITGAGHVSQLQALLHDIGVEVVKLSELK